MMREVEERFTLPRLANRALYFRYLNNLSVEVREGERERHKARSSVKTYLLEIDGHGDAALDELQHIVRDEGLSIDLVDEQLFRIKNGVNQYVGLAEFLDERFLLIATLLDVDQSDKLIRRLARSNAELDQVWLASDWNGTESSQ
jgi:hypothetical protein